MSESVHVRVMLYFLSCSTPRSLRPNILVCSCLPSLVQWQFWKHTHHMMCVARLDWETCWLCHRAALSYIMRWCLVGHYWKRGITWPPLPTSNDRAKCCHVVPPSQITLYPICDTWGEISRTPDTWHCLQCCPPMQRHCSGLHRLGIRLTFWSSVCQWTPPSCCQYIEWFHWNSTLVFKS